jgi:hypothetical protein
MTRASDRRRAAMRRNRQLGETEEQFQERTRVQLRTTTGYKIWIAKSSEGRYTVKAFDAGDEAMLMPLIKVSRFDLTAAARIVDECADSLRAGEARVKKIISEDLAG